MFAQLAHLMYRRRWTVVGIWVVILAVAFVFAAQVNKVLGPGDFSQKGSDSYKAAQILDHQFHQNDRKTSLVLMYSPSRTVREASFRTAVAATARRIQADKALQVSEVDNPLASGDRQFMARDGHSVALLAVSKLQGQALQDVIPAMRAAARTSGFTTYVLGTSASDYDYARSLKADLSKAEIFTLPILLIILLLVFGSVVAAGLPLLLAIFAIALSLALVFGMGHLIDTSTYVENVVTILGLGIAIDYTLFIVYRFRDELHLAENDVERAIVRTMETTGRAVFFSGLTVCIGLAALTLAQLPFMVAMGLGGALIPITAVSVAMTLLPAVLSLLGPRVNSLRVVPARFLGTGDQGFWHGMAMAIMRRPLVTGGVVLLIMLGLAYPATRLSFSFGSLKNADQSLESVKGYLFMQRHFPNTPDPTQVVVERQGSGSVMSQLAAIRSLENRLRNDPDAAEVVGPADIPLPAGPIGRQEIRGILGRYVSRDQTTAVIQIVPRHEVGTGATQDLVTRSRTVAAGFEAGPLRGNAIYVGGAQAGYNDFNDAMYGKFPLIVAVVLLLTYAFLFFAFRSVLLPLKAIVLNLLSVGASYGLLWLVFVGGVGSSLLGFSAESGVASWVPIFLFAFLFGLSMDYEVFLVSRIRERWLGTRNNTESVAYGLEKTGRLISSAAAIMVVAFGSFLIGHELQLKEFGFGMAASVALDATLIRAVLVPSIMEIMGAWNWWVPGFLHGFAQRGIPLGEGEAEPAREPVGVEL